MSLALLASAAALGVVLRHDGEIGAVENVHAIDSAGDDIRLKGDLVSYQTPMGASWQAVHAVLSNNTFQLDVDGPMVLVTGLVDADAAQGDEHIIDGRVVYFGVHPDDSEATLVVVAAKSVYEPYFAW